MAKDKEKINDGNVTNYNQCIFNDSQINSGQGETNLKKDYGVNNASIQKANTTGEQKQEKKSIIKKALNGIGAIADIGTVLSWIKPTIVTVVTVFGIVSLGSCFDYGSKDVLNEQPGTEMGISIIREDEERSTEEPPINVDDADSDLYLNMKEEEYYEPKWSDQVRLVDAEVMQSLLVEQRVECCEQAFDAKIAERLQQVEIIDEMPETYEEYVIKANEIYENYDERFEYDEKQKIVLDAADNRDSAKNEYRQESNEQIMGNYYAKCGINAREDGLIDQEFKYFQNAIDYYYDAYAVSIKNGKEKDSSLEYMATCFYNIARIENVDNSIKEEALISAVMLYQKYGAFPDNAQLKTNLNIGRCYSNLCILEEEDADKFFYFEKAVEAYEKCYNEPKCGKKMSPIVYDELIGIYQHCYDYIDEGVYEETISRDAICKKHDEYVKLRQQYD